VPLDRKFSVWKNFLAIKLFEHSHKQVRQTALGCDYLADIRGPLGQLADASCRIRELEKNSTVSSFAYPTFAIRWLIARWGASYDLYPNIDIRLTTSLNVAEFTSGH